MEEIIDDDLILSLEYYHDNPEYKKFFDKEKDFFDIINNKKIDMKYLFHQYIFLKNYLIKVKLIK
jgi:hypothetical protein